MESQYHACYSGIVADTLDMLSINKRPYDTHKILKRIIPSSIIHQKIKIRLGCCLLGHLPTHVVGAFAKGPFNCTKGCGPASSQRASKLHTVALVRHNLMCYKRELNNDGWPLGPGESGPYNLIMKHAPKLGVCSRMHCNYKCMICMALTKRTLGPKLAILGLFSSFFLKKL